MRGGLTKGLIIGGVVGASIGAIMQPDIMSNRTRRKVMRAGRNIIRRSGHWIGDIAGILR